MIDEYPEYLKNAHGQLVIAFIVDGCIHYEEIPEHGMARYLYENENIYEVEYFFKQKYLQMKDYNECMKIYLRGQCCVNKKSNNDDDE